MNLQGRPEPSRSWVTQNIEIYLDPKSYTRYPEYNLQPEVKHNLRQRCLNFIFKLETDLRSRSTVDFYVLEKLLFGVRETLNGNIYFPPQILK